jgi:hypothetical protein
MYHNIHRNWDADGNRATLVRNGDPNGDRVADPCTDRARSHTDCNNGRDCCSRSDAADRATINREFISDSETDGEASV